MICGYRLVVGSMDGEFTIVGELIDRSISTA